MTSVIEEQLIEIERTLVSSSEVGLTNKVSRELTNWLKGRTTEVELESFLAQKLNSTSLNLDQLETQEYPESAAEMHGGLHTAFVLYEEALSALEELLWRGAEPPVANLSEIFSALQLGDQHLQLFQMELGEKLAPLASIDTLW